MKSLNELLNEREALEEDRKNDPTDLKIREEFLKLLHKQPIEKITVSELCLRCRINRSTFYRHYEDLFQLLDKITAEAHAALFHDVIRNVDLGEEFQETGYNYILKVCEKTIENKELYRLLLYGNTQTGLRERMENSVFNLYFLAHEGPSNFRGGEDVHLHYQYMVKGIIGVFCMWVRDGFRPQPEKIARVVEEEISAFYDTMHRLYGRD